MMLKERDSMSWQLRYVERMNGILSANDGTTMPDCPFDCAGFSSCMSASLSHISTTLNTTTTDMMCEGKYANGTKSLACDQAARLRQEARYILGPRWESIESPLTNFIILPTTDASAPELDELRDATIAGPVSCAVFLA